MRCTGSCGMLVPVRWSRRLDRASVSITFPRAMWSRYSLVSVPLSTSLDQFLSYIMLYYYAS
jgi:hypothetical protein